MFDVTASPAEGATTVVTSIEDFATIQSTIGGFIPAGPKTMEGYPWYHQFLTNLEAGVRAKDPQAKTAIIERDLG